ncbi:MAG: PD40 domain-containing protein [Flavobacteriales bacterium]|nr:PD40 domain-containing protein [Flavobacteriales bacterium]
MRHIFLICFLLCTVQLSAQSPLQWSRHGDDALKEGDIYGAAFYYGKAAAADSNQMDIWMAWADALRAKNDYATAADVYRYIYESPFRNDKHAVALYWQARMMQSSGYYEDALQAYRSYANYHADKGSYLFLDARQQEISCNWAMLNRSDTLNYTPQTLGVKSNSIYSEFGGSLMFDTLLAYSSLQYTRKDSSMYVSQKEQGNKVGLYKAVYRDTEWVAIGALDSSLLGAFHYGNAHWLSDSAWLVYTECEGYGRCRIFIRRFGDGKFGPPFEPGQAVNTDGFTSTHPHLVHINGELYLFFSSNRPQGRGNLDIWYSKYEPRYRQFGVPKNMGKEVNSPGNEITPFFLPDSNRLYFSSDWHEGFGGFDIFYCEAYSLRSPRQPINLRRPLNSSANDLYFALYPRDSLLLLSSNRSGGLQLQDETCCNDIYYHRLQPAQPDTTPTPPDTPAPSPPIVWETFSLVLYFDNDHPHPRSSATHSNLRYRDCYQTLVKRREEYTLAYLAGYETIYHTQAKAGVDDFFDTTLPKGLRELERLMNALKRGVDEGRKITIVVKGYASPLADAAYNKRLSQRRIATLINELKHFDNGYLRPWLEGSAAGGGSIVVREEALGETKADPMVSDDRSNKYLSVFSPEACTERRVEIIQILEEQ